MAARRAGSSAWASSGEEDVTMGILGDEGEPGVEAGSEEATCRQRATKESMKMLQTEERTNERDSRMNGDSIISIGICPWVFWSRL